MGKSVGRLGVGLVVVSGFIAGCTPASSSGRAGVAAPTTVAGAPIDSAGVDLSHIEGPAGLGPASTTTIPDTVLEASLGDTSLPVATEPNPTAPAPTIAKTVPPTTPITTAAPVATTIAVAPSAAPIPKQKSTPITPAPEPVVRVPATRAPRRRATTAPPVTDEVVDTTVAAVAETLPPTTTTATAPTAPPTSRPKVVKTNAKLAVVGKSCAKSLVGQKRSTKSGGAAVCARTKKQGYLWIAVVEQPVVPQVLAPVPVPGFDGQTITLGVIGTTTNTTWSNISKAISAGFEARIAAINRRGGVAGKYPIKVLFKDANYDPGQTLVELGATKDRVVGYGSILGTPATEAAVPFLRANNLLASPASQEGRWAKEPNLLPVFNSYQVQAVNGVAYYLEQTPGATVCAVSIGTSFGDAGTEGFSFAAADLGAKVGAVVQMNPADTNPTPVLTQLAKAGCQGVVATVSPQQLVNLVMGAARANIALKWIILGAGFSDRIITAQTSKTFEQTCLVIGDGPMWGEKDTAQLAADLIASDNRYWTENPDVGLTFGYTQGRVWEAMLEAAVASGDLSRAGLLAASKTVGPVDTGGLGSPIDYRQPQRLSAPRATVYAVDGSYKNSIRTLVLAYSAPVASRFRLR